MSEAVCDPIEQLSLHGDAVVAERYRLVDRIGAGGMGSVWRATHVTLAHDVAIKFLQVTDTTAAARARFEREAKLAARLGEASRHITRVIDYGVFRGTIPYLVMELLQGETLSARVRREGKLSLEVASRLIVQLCRALQVAHSGGVIHRDIKPSNIFLVRSDLDDEPCVKLMDFGIAKSVVEADGEETTRAGTVIGTPGYMSPEQILSKRLDARTDLWGVAACLYRVVCGRTPFGQGGTAELGLRVLATDPPAPSTINPKLPVGLDVFMEKALAKSAEERYQSARDFADALALVGGVRNTEGSVVTTIVPLADEVAEPSSSGSLEPPTSHEGVEKRDWRKLPLGSLAVVLAALALATVVGARSRSSGGQAAEVAVPTRPRVEPEAPAAPPPANTQAPPTTSAVVVAAAAPPTPKSPPQLPAKKTGATKPAKFAKSPSNEGAKLWSKRDEL